MFAAGLYSRNFSIDSSVTRFSQRGAFRATTEVKNAFDSDVGSADGVPSAPTTGR